VELVALGRRALAGGRFSSGHVVSPFAAERRIDARTPPGLR
jgi:hypothetical protein